MPQGYIEQAYLDILLLWLWTDELIVSHLNRDERIDLVFLMDYFNLNINYYALRDDAVEKLRLQLLEEMTQDAELANQLKFLVLAPQADKI